MRRHHVLLALKYWKVSAASQVAIGTGRFSHMAKLAAAMGAHVTVLSHSPNKREDALRLGAGLLSLRPATPIR